MSAPTIYLFLLSEDTIGDMALKESENAAEENTQVKREKE